MLIIPVYGFHRTRVNVTLTLYRLYMPNIYVPLNLCIGSATFEKYKWSV